MTDILQEASELINGQRAKDYGDVSENFQRIADLWQTYLDGIHPINKIDCHDVAMMMILVKVARQSNGYHRDSAVDIAGYAALAEKVYDEENYQGPTFTLKFDNSPEPRVWESLEDVPKDVRVTSDGGHIWTYWTADSWNAVHGFSDSDISDPGWLFTQEGADILSQRAYRDAPFTEVLDNEPRGSK